MAKKKVTQKSNDTKEENPQEQNNQNINQHKTESHQNSMEDPSEQIQNLKMLNAKLLKGTIENRQQVDYLNQTREALETELRQCEVEKGELLADLSYENEKSVCLDVENRLFCAILITQMKEMSEGLDVETNERENEIRVLKSEANGLLGDIENERRRWSQACTERDLLRSELDCQVNEATKLKERLIEMEVKEIDLKSEILVIKDKCQELKNEKILRDGEIDDLKKERSLLEKGLAELEKEINDLKLKVEGIMREKKEFEKQNSEQKVKIDELEKEKEELNKISSGLQREEKALREMILELEKICNDAADKKEEMTLEIKSLMGQEREKQRSIEKLMEEKDEISQRLENALMDINDKEGRIANLLKEKKDIEERTVTQETEILGLNKEIGDLRDVVFKLKESCRDKEEKSKYLVNEVEDYKSALDETTFERDNALKDLDKERERCVDLRSKASEMEERMEEDVLEMTKIRNECENLIKQRKKLEGHIGLLMEEKESRQMNLFEAKQSNDDLRAKMELIEIYSGRALTMLKNTAAMLCQTENDVDDGKQEFVVNEKKLQDDSEPYAAELETIKNAFRNKEKLVEDMKQQVEIMQQNVAEAHKKKSFWTAVSSATTIFAAVSVAYVARIR